VTIYVSRGGQDIGSWPEEEFQALISSGEILPGDYFRFEGTSDWSLVSTYTPPDRQKPEGRSKTDPAEAKHDWRSDSATEKQINYLASFGLTASAGLTKGEASDLIERCKNDPEALARQAQLWEAHYEQERRNRAALPSFYLRADIASAAREFEGIKERRNKTKIELSAKKKQLATAKRRLERATDDDERNEIQTQIDNLKTDLEAAESELSDFPVELEDAQTELKDARVTRLSFWKATFRQDWVLSDDENCLGDFADTIDQLYAQYGRYFKVPTNKEVTDVLQALDNDSSDWDKREPQAFYATLKAKVPDCARKDVRALTSSRGQGCLVLFAGVVLLVLFVIIHWKS
jgi:hypothetical protein